MGPDTSVYGSCSAILNGEFFVFGGIESGQKKQMIFLNRKNSLTVNSRSVRLSTVC